MDQYPFNLSINTLNRGAVGFGIPIITIPYRGNVQKMR